MSGLLFLWLSGTAAWSGVFQRGEVIAVEGMVRHVSASGRETAATNGTRLDFGDRLTTDEGARAQIRWADKTEFRLRELSSIQLLPPENSQPVLVELWHGAIYLFSRDQPRELGFRTSHAVGGTRGTEYELRVTKDETVVTLFDGHVEVSVLTNLLAKANLNSNGTITVSASGKISSAGLSISNLVQWWLYYPTVLDLKELQFTPGESAALEPALTTYRRGDVRAAREAFRRACPAPQHEGERILHAALRLASGEADEAETALSGLPRQSATDGLLRLIRAVTA
ncbi:MAG TPA: FecR family protein, partial [Verrucomicrobiae bacterium]